jgi:hypothetical protein
MSTFVYTYTRMDTFSTYNKTHAALLNLIFPVNLLAACGVYLDECRRKGKEMSRFVMTAHIGS